MDRKLWMIRTYEVPGDEDEAILTDMELEKLRETGKILEFREVKNVDFESWKKYLNTLTKIKPREKMEQ